MDSTINYDIHLKHIKKRTISFYSSGIFHFLSSITTYMIDILLGHAQGERLIKNE